MHPEANEMADRILNFYSKSDLKNIWLEKEDVMKVYVRRSIRVFNDKRYEFNDKHYDCLDIASIELDSNFQRQGIFKDLLSLLEKEPINIFIENVLLKELQQYLSTRPGYIKIDNFDNISMSFVRLCK